jgi:hypothetical protein
MAMSKRADVYERLAASTPQNATAGRVIAKGEHYEPVVDFKGHWHADSPPPMLPVFSKSMIGKTLGRLAVVGILAADFNPQQDARWVVRCACGDYETRTMTAIKTPDNSDDRCQVCRHLVKVAQDYKELGPRPISDFINPPTASVAASVVITEPDDAANVIEIENAAWIAGSSDDATRIAKEESAARVAARDAAKARGAARMMVAARERTAGFSCNADAIAKGNARLAAIAATKIAAGVADTQIRVEHKRCAACCYRRRKSCGDCAALNWMA